MKLDRSIHEAIKREYSYVQNKAKREYDDKIAEIYIEHPRLKLMTKRLKQLYLEKAKSRIKNLDLDFDADIDALKEEIDRYIYTHGIKMPSPYKCKKCKDTGYLLNGKHCSCYSGIFRKVVYMGSEYNHLFDECTFENIDYMLYDNTVKDEAIPSNRESIRQIADQAARLARDFNNKVDIPYANFLLLGSVGVGKTYISIAIANEFIKKNIYVKFITAIKLADILSSYDDDMYKEYELLKEVPLLVIDDLGTEYGRGAFSSRFLDLISYRQSNKLPMVITSNMNISDIVDDYSERLWSKLQQNTRIYVIEQNDIRHKIN